MTKNEFQEVCNQLHVQTNYSGSNQTMYCNRTKVKLNEFKNISTKVGVKRLLTKHKVKYHE